MLNVTFAIKLRAFDEENLSDFLIIKTQGQTYVSVDNGCGENVSLQQVDTGSRLFFEKQHIEYLSLEPEILKTDLSIVYRRFKFETKNTGFDVSNGVITPCYGNVAAPYDIPVNVEMITLTSALDQIMLCGDGSKRLHLDLEVQKDYNVSFIISVVDEKTCVAPENSASIDIPSLII